MFEDCMRVLLGQFSYFSPQESKYEKKTWRDRKRQMELRVIENDAASAPGECANTDIHISLQPLLQQFYP